MSLRLRGFSCLLFALSLIVGSAAAAEPLLAPGKPAGVKKASTDENREAYWIAGSSAAILAVSSFFIFHSGGSSATATTGTAG
jgi:hypothetical protein